MCFWSKKYKSVAEIVEGKKENAKKICSWILGSIWYKSDEENHGVKEYWQTPQETLTGKYRDGKEGEPYSGDCEDFVILAQACLEKMGILSYILGVHTPTEYVGSIPKSYKGHAVLAFQLDDKWYHFSNWGLKRCWKATKLGEIAPYVYKKGYWQECWFTCGELKKGKIHTYNI